MSPRAECGKKDVEGLYRCELKPGHRGEHQAEWEGSIINWGRDKQTSRRINQPSTKQELRTAFLAGVKIERFTTHLAHRGRIQCEAFNCMASFPSSHFEEAWEAFDLHHVTQRSKAPGYRGNTEFGVDHSANLLLLCRNCHKQEHGQPQWSQHAAG